MRLRNIAVPVDDDLARPSAATALADRLALRSGAVVHLVGAYTEPVWVAAIGGEILYPPMNPTRAEVADKARRSLERDLESAAAALAAEADAEARTGEPIDTFVEYVNEKPIDLVIVSARGVGLVSRLLHNSVAGELSRKAPAPVLVLGRDSRANEIAARGFRSVTVGVKDAVTASLMTRMAAQLVEPPASLLLVHVTDQPAAEVAAEMFELESQVSDFLPDGVSLELVIERGEVAGAINRCAEESDADLVVVGSRPHASIGDRFFGTTADSVLAAGGRAILAVPELALASARETIEPLEGLFAIRPPRLSPG
jgi:nucleotide-binding universal stress UspA family protein